MNFKHTVKQKHRILDFDIECRPMAWYGGDFVTRQPTVIAARFIDDDISNTLISVLTPLQDSIDFSEFKKMYDEAGIVTGHFIRGYDLSTLNWCCVKTGLGPLSPKLTQDTKLDLLKFQGMSKSQENLAAYLGVKAPKVSMSVPQWELANSLTPKGIDLAVDRCVGDVDQHIELRAKLLELDALGPMKEWDPNSAGTSKYSA
jgi:hypothetical protein